MEKETKLIHSPRQRRDAYDALQMPVYHCLAFEFDNASVMADAFCGRTNAPDYSRVLNPTVTNFEGIIRNVTGSTGVSAFSSGMAAICAMIFGVASTGKNIVTSKHVFGNTYLLMTNSFRRFGVETRLTDLTDIAKVKENVDDNTCCIFLESVTNPQLEVADTQELSMIAKAHGIPLIADTTVIPFTEFDGRKIGIDFQIISSSKYVSGGATSLGGLIIDYGNFPELTNFLKKEAPLNLGSYMTPHAAYMQTLGLETLRVRFNRQADSTLQLARLLENTPGIVSVNYPGLESHRNHELFKRLYGEKAGAVLTFELNDEDTCYRFINALKLVHRATNLFDNRTLAIHPASTIFGPLSAQERYDMDVHPTTIRISVGLEDINDIYQDLRQAIDTANNHGKI